MQAYRFETVIPQSGEPRLKQLPFRPGEMVEVIVLPRIPFDGAADHFPLMNTVLKYESPTEPVAEEDWDALK